MISAGQDNTIRVWDPEDMTCLRVLQEGRSEITAMTFSSALNMPITGQSMPRCTGVTGWGSQCAYKGLQCPQMPPAAGLPTEAAGHEEIDFQLWRC